MIDKLSNKFNPYLVMLTSQIGSALDPQGVGGVLGKAAYSTMQSMLAAKYLQEQDKLNKELLKALVGALGSSSASGFSKVPDTGISADIGKKSETMASLDTGLDELSLLDNKSYVDYLLW